MAGTSIDLSAIQTDATSYAASFRTLIGVDGGSSDFVSYVTDQSGTTTQVQKNRALVNLGFNTLRDSGAFQFTADSSGTAFDDVRFSSYDTGGNGFQDAVFIFNAEEGIQLIHGAYGVVINAGLTIDFTDDSGVAFSLTGGKLCYYRTISPTADSTEVATTAWVNDLVAPRTFTFRFDGAGSAITTGAKKVYFRVPFACTITGWEIAADVSGSIVFDIWKDTYANYPPTVADSITASAKPTLTTATKSQGSTLTGWTTSLSAGDYIEINVDSASTVTVAMLTLSVTKV